MSKAKHSYQSDNVKAGITFRIWQKGPWHGRLEIGPLPPDSLQPRMESELDQRPKIRKDS
jgi:hypothetical protein